MLNNIGKVTLETVNYIMRERGSSSCWWSVIDRPGLNREKSLTVSGWKGGGGFLSDDADYSFKLKIEGESILSSLHLAGMHRCINDGRFQCGAVPLKPVIIVMVIKRVNK